MQMMKRTSSSLQRAGNVEAWVVYVSNFGEQKKCVKELVVESGSNGVL